MHSRRSFRFHCHSPPLRHTRSGALLLIAGLCTPAAALGLSSTMAVAMTLLIARGERFVDPGGHSWEASAFYMIATVTLLVAGPGRWSLDAIFWARVGRIREQFV